MAEEVKLDAARVLAEQECGTGMVATRDMKVPFEGMTSADQRRAIARDVIAQLDSGVYDPQWVGYLDWENRLQVDPYKAFSGLKSGTRRVCYVCGIGSLFATMVRRGEVEFREFEAARSAPGMRPGREQLGKYFSQEQLSMIELAFERAPTGDVLAHLSRNSPEYRASIEFSFRTADLDDRKERLRAIMQNIAEHGEFRPEKGPR